MNANSPVLSGCRGSESPSAPSATRCNQHPPGPGGKASAEGLWEPWGPLSATSPHLPGPQYTHLLLSAFSTFLQQPGATFAGTVLVLTVLHKCPEAARAREQASGWVCWPCPLPQDKPCLLIPELVLTSPELCCDIEPMINPMSQMQKLRPGASKRCAQGHTAIISDRAGFEPRPAQPQSLNSFPSGHSASPRAHLSFSCFCSST